MKRIVAVLLVVVIAAGFAVATMFRRGLSTRRQPTATEAMIARVMRRLATPSSARNARNPVELTGDALAEGRGHWADHCASCHANDGSGQTEMGRNLYPKAPDMRQPRTQDLTDGELFAIIKNGIRLTGMPAWGDPSGADDAETWKLVHFIRPLPKMTPREIEEMKRMNPVSAEELKEREFLEGR